MSTLRCRISDAWRVLRGDAIVERRRIVVALCKKTERGDSFSRVVDIPVVYQDMKDRWSPGFLELPAAGGGSWCVVLLK